MFSVEGNKTPGNHRGTDECQDKCRRACSKSPRPLASDEVGKTGCHATGRARQSGKVLEGTRGQSQLLVSSEAARARAQVNRQAETADEKQAPDGQQQLPAATDRVTRFRKERFRGERRIVHPEPDDGV